MEVNPVFERILGLSHDQIIGKRYKELVPVDTTRWFDVYSTVARTGKPMTYEFYSNEYQSYFETYSYRPTKGQVSVLVRNITDRKKAEGAIRESEERYRIILEKSFDGIFIHENFKILDLNQAMIKMTGYSRSELLGNIAIDLFTPESKEVIREYISSGSKGSYEVKIIRKDGTIRQVESIGAPCEFQGRNARIVAITDITEQKRAEKEVQERVKELEDFYAMAVGRELRMKELKEEMSELKGKLGKYEKLDD